MHFNGLTLSHALEYYIFTSRYLGSKCKYELFKENIGFECGFVELNLIILHTRLTDLQKHHTLEGLLMTDLF